MVNNHNNGKKKANLFLRFLVMFIFIFVIAFILGAIKYKQIQKLQIQGQSPLPPTPVTVAQVEKSKWNKKINAVGTLKSSQGVNITPEVGGIVKQINFVSAQQVNLGDLLLRLADEEEISAVDAAQSEYDIAQSQYRRSVKLGKKKFVSENELDLQRSRVSVTKSALALAKARLDKKRIYAPFSGLLGIRQIDVGDYISPGMSIVSLQNINNLYLDFTLPEANFTNLSVNQKVQFAVKSYGDEKFNGVITAWNPIIDENTRNISVRAEVDNSQQRLLPGMFSKIQVISNQLVDVFVIPETAIFYNIYGEAVYVLEDNSEQSNTSDNIDENSLTTFKLNAKQIDVLYRKDGYAGINKGLRENEKVVTSGQLKLYPSLVVQIIEDAPDFSLKQSSSEKTMESEHESINTQ